MITRKNNFVFDFDVVNNETVENLVRTPGVSERFITNEGVGHVKDILDLENREYKEINLRAIRNSVVKSLNDRMRTELGMDDDGKTSDGKSPDFKRMMEYSSLISAIASVIDKEMWNRGYTV